MRFPWAKAEFESLYARSKESFPLSLKKTWLSLFKRNSASFLTFNYGTGQSFLEVSMEARSAFRKRGKFTKELEIESTRLLLHVCRFV